ncbi:MAG: hypothetical protein AAGI68_11405 [Planctomycetota bacterium]
MSADTLEAPAEQSVESRLDDLLQRINQRGDDPIEGLPPAPKDPGPPPPSPVADSAARSPGDALLDQQIDATLAAASSPASAAPPPTASTGKTGGERDAQEALDNQLASLLDAAQAEAQLTSVLPQTARPAHAEPELEPEDEARTEEPAAEGPLTDGPTINHKAPSSGTTLSRPEARSNIPGEQMLDDGSAVALAAGDNGSATPEMSIDELDDLIAGEEVEGDFETVDAVVQSDVLPGTPGNETLPDGADDSLGYSFASPQEVAGAVGLDDEPPSVPSADTDDRRPKANAAWIAGLLERLWFKLAVMPDLLGHCRVALGWLNLPVYRYPVWVRQTLGLAGLITVFNALALLIYALVA